MCLTDSKAGRRAGELDSDRGKALVAQLETASLCDWLGEHIWFSLLRPKLEVGSEMKEAVGYGSSLAFGGQWQLGRLSDILDWLPQVV